MGQLRIFIADPNRNGRLAMQMLLDHQPGMQVVGIAVEKERLVEQVTAVQPDVVLIAWELMSLAPASLINELRINSSNCQIIVLDVRAETKQAAWFSGADGFVSKDSPPDKLLSTLKETKQNNIFLNS